MAAAPRRQYGRPWRSGRNDLHPTRQDHRRNNAANRNATRAGSERPLHGGVLLLSRTKVTRRVLPLPVRNGRGEGHIAADHSTTPLLGFVAFPVTFGLRLRAAIGDDTDLLRLSSKG